MPAAGEGGEKANANGLDMSRIGGSRIDMGG